MRNNFRKIELGVLKEWQKSIEETAFFMDSAKVW